MEIDWYKQIIEHCCKTTSYNSIPQSITSNVFTDGDLTLAIYLTLHEINPKTLHYDGIKLNLFTNPVLLHPELIILVATRSNLNYTWIKPVVIMDETVNLCDSWLRCWSSHERFDDVELNEIETWIKDQVRVMYDNKQTLLSILARDEILLPTDIHKLIVDYTYGFTRISS